MGKNDTQLTTCTTRLILYTVSPKNHNSTTTVAQSQVSQEYFSLNKINVYNYFLYAYL